jgi:hypothetical protein
VSVTTISPLDPEARAGQLVMLAAQLVTVWTVVVKMVRVVNSPPAADEGADEGANEVAL